MVPFEPHGPFVVPSHKGPPRFVDREHVAEFWALSEPAGLAERRGVYLLAVRAGPGITPVYVGKTSRSFAAEALVDRSLQGLNAALRAWRRARPVMLLVTQPIRPGPDARRAVAELEDFLIVLCAHQNPELRNVQGTGGSPPFELLGLTERRRGAPTSAARALRRAVGWSDAVARPTVWNRLRDLS